MPNFGFENVLDRVIKGRMEVKRNLAKNEVNSGEFAIFAKRSGVLTLQK